MTIGIPLPADADDVTRYIFHNYRHLLSTEEQVAWKAISAYYKAEGDETSAACRLAMRELAINTDRRQEVLRDPLTFYVAVRDRLLTECAQDIVLNHCPKCGALARTPKARLCPQCGYSWHHEEPHVKREAGPGDR